jgi:predicted pyridoxine 5'-phosphate oxidase superfamily flavin-nucleotide-binding protein
MAERFESLEQKHIQFIQAQHMFFVATAGSEGKINLSPKGMDSLRVINNTTVAWLNLTGSGNESAAHIRDNNRMTIMFCSFDKQPLILRLYGKAKAIHQRDAEWQQNIELFPAFTGARQVFILEVDMVQTSCGYAVPKYELVSERDTLTKWADNRGRDGIEEYWAEKNTLSLDGAETGIFND